LPHSKKNIEGLSSDVPFASVQNSITELTQKTETVASALNSGLRKVQQQVSSLEEGRGEKLSAELEGINKACTTLDQIHELQQTMMGTLEKQELSSQNRILPVAELSVWPAADFMASTMPYYGNSRR